MCGEGYKDLNLLVGKLRLGEERSNKGVDLRVEEAKLVLRGSV